jgi:hypothetical protein
MAGKAHHWSLTMTKRLLPPLKQEYDRRYYERHRDVVIARRLQARKELAEWFYTYKATQACERCRENDSACLDFHHRDPAKKSDALGRAIWLNGWNRERVLKEIAKCTVLCANCHRKFHAGRFALDDYL